MKWFPHSSSFWPEGEWAWRILPSSWQQVDWWHHWPQLCHKGSLIPSKFRYLQDTWIKAWWLFPSSSALFPKASFCQPGACLSGSGWLPHLPLPVELFPSREVWPWSGLWVAFVLLGELLWHPFSGTFILSPRDQFLSVNVFFLQSCFSES